MFQDPTSRAVDGGTGISGFRTNPVSGSSGGGGGGGAGEATTLLAAGPTQGELNAESDPWTIVADGTLSAPVTVTPSVSGGSATFSPTSDSLESGGSVTFTITPSTVGDLTVTFAAPGLTSAIVGYEAITPDPGEIDLSDKWLLDANPANAFEASQGTVPAGVVAHSSLTPPLVNKVGADNKIRFSLELPNQGIYSRDAWKTYSDVTATAVEINEEVAGFEFLRRVADPADGAKWAYEHRGDRNSIGWSSSNPDKWRCEVSSTGTDRYEDWGTEEWMVMAVRFPSYWRSATPGPFHIVAQFHDSTGGLTGGAMIDLSLVPGGTSPSSTIFEVTVKHYVNPEWPVDQSNKKKVNFDYAIVANPSANAWHWFVFNYRSGNGFADYPNYVNAGNWGAPDYIYGPSNSSDCFVRVYHAVDNAAPVQVLNRVGHWGSPHETSSTQKHYVGYWKTGLYTSCKFEPTSIGTARALFTKGFRVYRAADAPGMSVLDVLRDFRGV